MSLTFSIITACLNSASTIPDCLDSIKKQQNVEVEHIIIDGGSSDCILDIVKNYPHVARIISEPDCGMYDAMNKGIVLATGDVIGILNSDDYYALPSVLTKVAETFSDPNVDSCYADLIYVDSVNTSKVLRYWKSGNINDRSFYWGWMPPHPVFFVRREVYEKYGPYRLDLGSAADYEFMLRVLVKYKISTAYIPQILVKMRAGGESNSSLKTRFFAHHMDRKAWSVNGLKPYPWTVHIKPIRKIPQWFAPYFSKETKLRQNA